MQIHRYLDIESALKPSSVLVLLGPRRSGKTTLLQAFMQNTKKSFAFYRGDDLSTRHSFSLVDSTNLINLVGDNEVLVIDEAQMIPNIGQSLKLIVDVLPNLLVVVTGSSAFELAGQVGEPLTGRKHTKYLFPVAVRESLADSKTPRLDFTKGVTERLIYGSYPSIVTTRNPEAKAEYLKELVNSYLLKDILAFQEVKGSAVILRLISLLAYQIGSQVSLTELGSSLQIDRKTVERYLDLLEKTYVIFRLGGYSRNLRSETTKMSKYYFYDTGVRNAVIQNFNPLDIRNDVGQLWENYVISERQKRRLYYGPDANQYFWRTWKGSEIDLVEERGGKLIGYEIKWSNKKRPLSVPKEWVETYSDEAEWHLLSPDSAYDFLVP